MESAKHGNSETSSDTKVNDDDTTGTGRSYECTFCRRGFTNAQALGGHMNIHRKDKAKAKAKAKQQLSTHDSPASKYYAPLPISSEKPHHYAALGDQMMNYDQFYNFPASNPSFVPYPYGHHVNDHLPVSRSEPAFSGHEEKNTGVNLSLQISPPHMEDSREKKKGMKENEVDLELRLGH